MSIGFADTLKRLRIARGLSQRELAEQLYVTRSTVARWENGSRLPDAAMISKISHCLGVDVGMLLADAEEPSESTPPHVMLVDDRKIVLSGSLLVIKQAMPSAEVVGFTRPAEAVAYAKEHQIALAFLDIELGRTNGFELCRTLLRIYPRTNVVYLTAFVEYSFDAWSTGASGFMLKPLTPEGIQAQLKNLRHPILGEGARR